MKEEVKHPSRYNQGGIEFWDVEKAFFGMDSHIDHLHELPGGFDGVEPGGDDCKDFEMTEEAMREEREFYEVEKADAKRKGEW